MPRFVEDQHPRWPAGAPDGRGGKFRDSSTLMQWAQALIQHTVPSTREWRDRRTVLQMAEEAEFRPDSPPARLAGGAMAQTQIRTVGGRPIVRKQYDATVEGRRKAAAEELASLVGAAIEAPVPAAVVSRHNPSVAYIGFVPGEPAFHAGGGLSPDTEEEEAIYHLARTRAGLRLGLLDVLIANTDRHSLNWIASDYPEPPAFFSDEPVRMPVGIDHGETFRETPKTRYTDERGTWATPAEGDAYVGFMRPWLVRDPAGSGQWQYRDNNPLHPDDVPVMRARLRALQGEFERHGWGKQYRAMMQRFEAVAAHAGGRARLTREA